MTNLPNDYEKKPGDNSIEEDITSKETNGDSKIEPEDVSVEEDITEEPVEETITLEEIDHHGDDNRQLKSVSASGKIRYKKKSIKKHKHRKHHRKHHHGKHGHKRSKGSKLKRVLIRILIVILIILLLLCAAFLILRYLGKKGLLDGNQDASISTIDGADSDDNGQTVYYNGHKYQYNENVASIVFLGVDQSELDTDVIGEAGQADAVYVFTYDTESEECNLISVSRETMTNVRMYSAEGAEMGLENMQLCLAYSYGDGRKTSCENTLAALSHALYNIPFSNYIAMNWNGIAPLNDAIGGVELVALEDVTTDYSSIKEGETITLMGQGAWSYVKYRDTSELTSNTNRLNRQKQYINAYISKLIPMVRDDLSLINDLVDTASDYIYSNISTSQLVYIASEILPNMYSTDDFNFITIDGEIKQGETYAEFYPDETALYETILDVYYTQIN